MFLVPIFIIMYSRPIQQRFLKEFETSFSEILNNKNFEKGRVYTGTEARLLQFRAFKEIIDTPKEYVLGLGLGASKKEISRVHEKLNTPKVFQTYNFHNQYLQVFAELGLVGLILLLMMLWIGLKKGATATLFLPFILISTFLFFSESVIWRQRGIMFFGLLYVLLFTLNIKDESQKSIREV